MESGTEGMWEAPASANPKKINQSGLAKQGIGHSSALASFRSRLITASRGIILIMRGAFRHGFSVTASPALGHSARCFYVAFRRGFSVPLVITGAFRHCSHVAFRHGFSVTASPALGHSALFFLIAVKASCGLLMWNVVMASSQC